jgi:hypothetical protein
MFRAVLYEEGNRAFVSLDEGKEEKRECMN